MRRTSRSIHTLLLAWVIFQSHVLSQVIKTDSTQSSSGLFAYPVLFYSPETRWAYGAAMTVFHRSERNRRPSTWIPLFIYTQNKQIISTVTSDLYGPGEKWHFFAWIGYYDYPDKFFGIGSQTTDSQKESYAAKRFILRLIPKWRIQNNLYAGVQYEGMHQQLYDLEEDGELILKKLPGTRKSVYSGFGCMLSWDTRDNIYFPVKGRYHQVELSWFHPVFGSDFNFQRAAFDFRRYLHIRSNQTVAIQILAQMIFGVAPFQSLSDIGNAQIMRGTYEGRFRDNHFLGTQAEYRFFILGPLGAVLFGGVGDVAHRLNDFQIHSLKYSIGFGFRLNINPEERMNVRIDFGYGKNTSGLYIEIGEAF
jgi:outer membrane protein assembly factor BamA